MKVTCFKEMTFCSSHRIVGHEGKCRELHGHNYKIKVEVLGDKLDELGRVVDFYEIKNKIGLWIDENLDHGTLIGNHDKELLSWVVKNSQKYFVFDGNTTAENMAVDLVERFNQFMKPFGVSVLRVTLWETDTCGATAERSVE